MAETKTERITIRLTKALLRRLKRLAAEDRRKLSTYVELALEEYADRKSAK